MRNCSNFGVLIRLNREHQNINLITLSELSGISTSQLSKIERGIESATNDTLSYIFEALDINFEFIKEELNNISFSFNKFYSCIYYFEPIENAKIIIDELNRKYISEFISVELILANLMYYLTYEINIDKAKNYIDLLFNLIECLTPYQKQLFYDYCGIYYKEIRRFDKAIYYYKLSIETNNNQMITAMAYYHLGIVYRKNNQLLKSYGCIQKAKDLFISNNNFRRSMMADLVIANLHSANAEYDEALELLDICLDSYKRINAPLDEIATIYLNILWINIITENYIKAKKVLDGLESEILNILIHDLNFTIYKIILYIKFSKYNEALELCKNTRRNYNENNIDHNFIMYYYYLIHNNKTKRLKHLNKIKTLIFNDSSFIELRLLFKLLDNECNTKNQLVEFKDLLLKYIFNSFDD